jgi:ABC-type thiamine transport system substrate-binding protein
MNRRNQARHLAFAEKFRLSSRLNITSGVLKNAPHPNVGHLFVIFMASAEVQDLWKKYTGHTSAYIPGTDAYKFVQGKQVVYHEPGPGGQGR